MLFPNNSGRLFCVCVVLTLFLGSCKAFINTESIGFSVYPAADNTVLDEDTSDLSVRFDTAMDMLATEKIISVQSSGSSVKGDVFWRKDELVFTPLEKWQPGVRYSLVLDGTLFALDGREERIKKYVCFYALHCGASPYVVSFSPDDGASVGVKSNDGARIQITFSLPMDRQSAEDAFYMDGAVERNFIWTNDDTVMEIYPKNNLNPWTVYRWNLSNKAKGKNGVPLGREIGGRFVTDADRILPAVKEVFPLIRGSVASQLWWLKTGAPMENGLGSGQAIGILFNKAMDESVLRTIRFEPPLAGRYEMWKNDTVVFIPDRDPEPEKNYTLIVSADSRDTGGLKMEKDFSLSFIADIPFLTIVSVNAGFGGIVPEQNSIYPAASVVPEGICTITVRFSHAINPSSRPAIVLASRLEIFFPGILMPVSLRSARWWSADTVILQWEGLERSAAEESHYYKLVLPGGRNGISDGKGSYLKEDMIIFLKIEE